MRFTIGCRAQAEGLTRARPAKPLQVVHKGELGFAFGILLASQNVLDGVQYSSNSCC